MQTFRSSLTTKKLLDSGEALVAVAAITALLLIIGQATLGEGVAALLLLVPVAWGTTRGGPVPGMVAAISGENFA